eukprot:gene9763-13134_t
MIIPSFIPPSSVGNLTKTDLASTQEFISHIGIIGPVLIVDSCTDASYNPTNLIAIIRTASCMLISSNISVSSQESLVTSLLDNGLAVLFMNISVNDEDFNEKLSTFPRSRIGLILSNKLDKLKNEISNYRDLVGHFVYNYQTSESDSFENIISYLKEQQIVGPFSFQVYINNLDNGLDESKTIQLATMTESSHVMVNARFATNLIEKPILTNPLYDLNSSVKGSSSDLDLVDLFIGCLRTDRVDGMYSTVVCDEQGVCLGLVYSNKESIRAALSERKGIYWSRSRGSLWRKGDSSGMFQELLEMKYDCDRDALRFIVIQHGSPASFCHLVTRTCWGPERGIQRLQSMLQERKQSAPVGSYTKRLFDDPDLLRKKLLEEVQELVEATEPDHIAAEAADVMYFMLTRCIAGGVTISDIEKHLDKRSLKVMKHHLIDWDQINVAEDICRKVGINVENCHGRLLPNEKKEWIVQKKLKYENSKNWYKFHDWFLSSKSPIMMIGDGINDSVALSAADIGIALAEDGTAMAVSSANVILLHNNLMLIPQCVSLCQLAMNCIIGSIILTIIIKMIASIYAIT